MHYPAQLPLTPPASPPTTKLVPVSLPTHVCQLPKGLRKKKAKKRRSSTADKAQDTKEDALHNAKALLTPCCPSPPVEDISDLYLDPPCANVCKLIRSLMVQDLLAASRAVCPCREITIHVPLHPAFRSDTSGDGTTCGDIYRARQEKRKLLGLHDGHLPRLGEQHGTCPIGKCRIKRCLLWDSLLHGEICDGESPRSSCTVLPCSFQSSDRKDAYPAITRQ